MLQIDRGTHLSSLLVGDQDLHANGVEIAGSAAGVAPAITAVGDDTNISIALTPKGTGQVRIVGAVVSKTTVATITTAGAVTYTAAQLLGGLIKRDPNGAGRSDVTPTGTLICAAIPGVAVGSSFEFVITNDADAAETITLTAGTDVTLVGTMTIAQNASRRFRVVVTDIALKTVTIYSVGSFTT